MRSAWLSILALASLAASSPASSGRDATNHGGSDPAHKRDGRPLSPIQPPFYKGHDLSSLLMLEESDNIYVDTQRNNETRPADDILADGGMNGVRLRIWVNPVAPGTNGLEYTLQLARYFQAKG